MANHGLETGDVIEYDANGHAVITGYQGPHNETVLHANSDGTTTETTIAVLRQYNVIRLSANTLALGNAFVSADVDGDYDTITFSQAHNFYCGTDPDFCDKVTFVGTTGGGLTNGHQYYVLVVDERTIRLVDASLSDAKNRAQHPEQYLKNFTAGDVNTSGHANEIHLGSNGFTLGQAVTYYAPAPVEFHSTQVDVTGTSTATTSSTFTDNPDTDNIYFVYQRRHRTRASALTHGFETNDKVVYHVGAATAGGRRPIGGLVDGQTYVVIRVDDYSIQLKHSVTVHNGRVADQEQHGRGRPDRPRRRARTGPTTGSPSARRSRSRAAFSGTYTIASVSGSTMTLTAATHALRRRRR